MSRSRNISTPGSPGRASPTDAAKLAHELSNLLDGSLRNLSLALTRLDDAAAAQHEGDDTTQRLRSSADAMRQMAMLLHRFMDAGRSGDAATLHWSESTLGDAAAYAARMIEPIATSHRIEVDIDLGEAASMQAGPLYPVIANALRNAAESIGRGGRIEVRGRRERDTIVLDIADDGPGVRGDLPRDATGLVRAGVTSKAGGHGMGMALSRQIVESIGGTIMLSDREPRGAVLTVRWKA